MRTNQEEERMKMFEGKFIESEDGDFDCGFCPTRWKNPHKPLHGVNDKPCSKCALASIFGLLDEDNHADD